MREEKKKKKKREKKEASLLSLQCTYANIYLFFCNHFGNSFLKREREGVLSVCSLIFVRFRSAETEWIFHGASMNIQTFYKLWWAHKAMNKKKSILKSWNVLWSKKKTHPCTNIRFFFPHSNNFVRKKFFFFYIFILYKWQKHRKVTTSNGKIFNPDT